MLWILLISAALLKPASAKNIFIEGTKKTVVFLFAPDSGGNIQPLGTGFLAGIKIGGEQNRYFLYLVTAKHVIVDERANVISPAFLRLNKREGGSEFLRLETKINNEDAVFMHPKNALVDLVVIPVSLDDTKYDFKFIQNEAILSKEGMTQLEISEGASVFFTGLFAPFVGQGRNYPVVRSGTIALLTDELIPWRTDPNKRAEMAELLLLETQSFGGNSGSPVFVTIGPFDSPELRLIGVMKGTFEQPRPISALQNGTVAVAKQNLGIAAVVPAQLLRDILLGEPLTKFRDSLQQSVQAVPSNWVKER